MATKPISLEGTENQELTGQAMSLREIVSFFKVSTNESGKKRVTKKPEQKQKLVTYTESPKETKQPEKVSF